MERVTLIANPAAGRGRTTTVLAEAKRVLRGRVGDLRVLHTKAPGQAAELAATCGAETDLLVAVGGDGTLGQVLAGLCRLPAAAAPLLGVIPAGTGNDFAQWIGVSPRPAEAAEQLLAGTPHPLDHAVISPGEMPFLNIAGCGFDARVAAWLNRGRRLLSGRAAYIQGVLRELVALRSMPARLQVDDQVLEGDFLLIALANGSAYGCGMRIAPEASATDGLLDVVAIDRVSRARFLRHFSRVFAGTHLDLPEVHVLRGRHVRLETERPAPVLVDGDVCLETPIEARVRPAAVAFVLPPGSPVLRQAGPPAGHGEASPLSRA